MNKQKIAKILAIVVTVGGGVVMTGWIFDIDILKSILPVWVTMKFSTALSFFLSGVILYFIVEHIQGKVGLASTVLPLPCLLIALLMATLLLSVCFGIRTGVEDLFVKEGIGAIKTTTPGRPSTGTMIAFISIVLAGLFTLLKLKNLESKLSKTGWVITVAGGLAIIGYMINVPLLYYTFEGVSTAMAFHTAILFTMIGVGLNLVGKK